MNKTLIYLQQICEQLKELLGLGDGFNVAALIDESDPHKIQGWCIVKLQPDGSMQPIDDKRYKTIRELAHQGLVAVVKGEEIAKAESNFHPRESQKKGRKNDATHFELISINNRILENEYQWCLDNLPLKDGRGLSFQASEIYITTSSQMVLDKVNKHFGSAFDFKNRHDSRVFYID